MKHHKQIYRYKTFVVYSDVHVIYFEHGRGEKTHKNVISFKIIKLYKVKRL